MQGRGCRYKSAASEWLLAALSRKKRLAKNNLAGATYEQSISSEMQAVSDRYRTKIQVGQDRVTRLRGDASELRNPTETLGVVLLMLTMLAGFATFERDLIRERQREGITLAKACGDYKGRKKALVEPEEAIQLREMADAGMPKAEPARTYGISRETVYSYLKAS